MVHDGPRMVRPHNESYGLGFWLGPFVALEGSDAGVSFRSVHQPDSATTYTVISNTSEGAWPVIQRLLDV